MGRPLMPLAAVLAQKAALVAVSAFVLAGPSERFGLVGRAVAYPLAALAVPAGWLLVRRVLGRPARYPFLLDAVVVTPFLVDLTANVADVPSGAAWWPFASHLFNWTLLAVACTLLLPRHRLGRLTTAALAVGFGAAAAILWEIAEYPTLHRAELQRATGYDAHVADLGASLAGSVIGALVAVTLLWPRRRPDEG